MTRLVRFDAGTTAYFPRGVIDALLSGGMAIYPTDTLYGLGVDPRSAAGLARLAATKGREGGKPIPLLLDDPARAYEFALHVPSAAARLMDRFWPGGLTVVLPASPRVPAAVTAGTGTVGLRVPDHPVPRALARALAGAITGTSANRSGNPGDWREAEDVVREFTGEVDWVLWDGPSRAMGSTVVRAGEEDVVVIREGAIPARTVTDFLERG